MGTRSRGVASKARSLDKVLAEENKGYDDVLVWPLAADAPPQKQLEEEDLLGYEVAEPSPKSSNMPRRSSLSSRCSAAERTNRRASIGYTGEDFHALYSQPSVFCTSGRYIRK